MARTGWLPKPLLATYLTLVLLVILEVAVQWRSHVRFGQSVFAMLQGRSPYLFDAQVGLMLLRPDHVSLGEQQRIAANRHGLRSPDIPEHAADGTYRIAVLGASTVMGAFAARNELTFPALLEAELNRAGGPRRYEVINAGIAGLTLAEQAQLFDRLVSRFRPNLTIVYPGFNDFGRYCRAASGPARWHRQPLVDFGLPAWLLSVELLLKNSVPLRTLPDGIDARVDAAAVDLAPYRNSLNDLFTTLKRHGTEVLIARNTRSYRREQPAAEQARLSETARFYNPCFDVEGLHTLFDRHNEAIVDVASRSGVPSLALDQAVPGGAEYFADASHFSAKGERLVASWLAAQLVQIGVASRPAVQP